MIPANSIMQSAKEINQIWGGQDGERRRHNRLVLTLPVRYSDAAAEVRENPGGLGVLKNISLGGLYFECPPPVAIKKGDLLQFSIAASLPSLDLQDTSNLAARGEVVRLDPPGAGQRLRSGGALSG